jgi:alkylhydroperoxidase family enzyme
VRAGAGADGWTPREALLLRAADELHETRTMSDELWGELRPLLNDQELIELCMLIGHYEMLAMTLNALCVEPESSSPVPRAASAR